MPAYDDMELSPPPPLTSDPTFDILDWHPAYQSCQRFFLDHAQHEHATQALCALINIRLPFQYFSNPIDSSAGSGFAFTFPRSGTSPPNNRPRPTSDQGAPPPSTFVSLIPYIKRLVVTGFDKPAILHGLFGDDYKRGILPHLDCERRNYLFAAKHQGWGCKSGYDNGSGTGGDESVPFMKPLCEAQVDELTAAERAWSGWLAMEDWMIGPRAPKDDEEHEHENAQPSASHHGQHEARNVVNGADNLPDAVPEAFQEEGNAAHLSNEDAPATKATDEPNGEASAALPVE